MDILYREYYTYLQYSHVFEAKTSYFNTEISIIEL